MILKRTDSTEQTERRFQRAVHVAAGLLSWLLPDSDAVVEATRLEDQDIQGELPDELQDPFAVFDRGRQALATAPVSCCDGSDVTNEGLSLTQLAEEVMNTE